jgi:hypothetical protein
MAVLVTNGDVSLNTANGFYVSYANNFGVSTGNVAIGAELLIPLTFSSNHTCIGAILPFNTAGTNLYGITQGITCELQENSGGWVTRKSDYVLPCAEGTAFFQPFDFGVGYAVTTAALTWRLRITQDASGPWAVNISTTATPSYVTYSSTTASFVSGADMIALKDNLTINQTATIHQSAGTGGTSPVSLWLCKPRATSTTADCATRRLNWVTSPAASYTLTLNGQIFIGAFTGIEVGDSTHKNTFANQAKIVFVVATIQGFAGLTGSVTNLHSASMQFWGESPTVSRVQMTADAASGQAFITVSDTTGWAVNDVIIISSSGENASYTIKTIVSPTSIELTTNLAVNKLKYYWVYKVNGYGVQLASSTTTSVINHRNGTISKGNWEGVLFYNMGFFTGSGGFTYDLTETQLLFNKCLMQRVTTTGGAFLSGNVQYTGMKFLDCNFSHSFPYSASIWSYEYNGKTYAHGPIDLTQCYVTNQDVNGQGLVPKGRMNYDTVVFMANSGTQEMGLSGLSSTFKDVDFMSISPRLNNLYNATITNLRLYNSTSAADYQTITLDGTVQNTVIDGFENIEKSIDDFDISTQFIYLDLEIRNTKDVVTFKSENAYNQTTLIEGSNLRVVNEDLLTNSDYQIRNYGRIIRCGTALTDTTAYGSNSFSFKFTPNFSPNLLSFTYDQIIGNQSGYDMFVYMWVKINSANYWASTYRLPRLYVTYDQTSVSYSQAAQSTAWQQLIVPIKPTTTYPSITIKLDGYTDATGTDRDFYLGQIGVVLPAGRNVDPGTLAYWSKAQPLTGLPTSLSAFDVWAVPISQLTGTGTIGKVLAKSLIVAKFLGLK